MGNKCDSIKKKKECAKTSGCAFSKSGKKCIAVNNSCGTTFKDKVFKGKKAKGSGSDSCACKKACGELKTKQDYFSFDVKKGKCYCFTKVKSGKQGPKVKDKTGFLGGKLE